MQTYRITYYRNNKPEWSETVKVPGPDTANQYAKETIARQRDTEKWAYALKCIGIHKPQHGRRYSL